ncbi:MAG: tetratricopeptide repeat protein [Fibrobacterota bacterium]
MRILIPVLFFLCGTAFGITGIFFERPQNNTGLDKNSWLISAAEEYFDRSFGFLEGAHLTRYNEREILRDIRDISLSPSFLEENLSIDYIVSAAWEKSSGEQYQLVLNVSATDDSTKAPGRIAASDKNAQTVMMLVFSSLADSLGIPRDGPGEKAFLEKITEKDKSYASFSRACGFIARKEYNKGIYAFERALVLDNGFSLAWSKAAAAYVVTGQKDKASDAIKMAAKYGGGIHADIARSEYLISFGKPEEIKSNIGRLKLHGKNELYILKEIARSYSALESYSLASAAFMKCLERSPSSLEFYYYLGLNYLKNNDSQKAVTPLRKLIAIAPGNSEYRCLLANALRGIGNYREALQIYRDLTGDDPTYIPAYSNMAVVHIITGQYAKALLAVRNALFLDSTLAGEYANKGLIFYKQDMPDSALSAYKKAIDSDPANSSAYMGIGSIFLEKGEYKKALKYYSKAARYDPENLKLKLNIGTAYFLSGNNKKASDYFNDYLQYRNEDFYALGKMAEIYLADQKYTKAVEIYFRMLGIRPESDELRLKAGNAFLKMGKKEQAIDLYEEVVRRNPGNSEYHLVLVEKCLTIGWNDVAALKAGNYIKQNGDDFDMLLALGKAYYGMLTSRNVEKKNRMIADGLYALKKAVSMNSADTEANFWLGRFYCDIREDCSTARKYFEKCSESGLNADMKKYINSVGDN